MDDVVAVALKDGVGFERVFSEVDEGEVVRAIDVGDIEQFFKLGDAFVGEGGGAVLFVDGIVVFAAQVLG